MSDVGLINLAKDQMVSLSVGALSAVMVTIGGIAMGWGSNSKQVEVNTGAINEIKSDNRQQFIELRKEIQKVGEGVQEINRYLRNRQ